MNSWSSLTHSIYSSFTHHNEVAIQVSVSTSSVVGRSHRDMTTIGLVKEKARVKGKERVRAKERVET